jgi:hypothetical protein
VQPSAIPIVGARTLTQFEDTMQGIDLSLPASDLELLSKAASIDLGFPHDVLQMLKSSLGESSVRHPGDG